MKNMKVLSLLLLLVTAEMHSSYANPDLSFIGAYQMADAFAKNVAPASSSSAYSSAKYLLGGVALTAAAIAAANTVYNYSQGNNLLDTSAAQGLASNGYNQASSNLNDLFTYTANLLGYQTNEQTDAQSKATLIQQAAQVAAQADAAHAQYYEDISNAADNAMNGGTGIALTAEEVHMLAPYAAGILAAGTVGVGGAIGAVIPRAAAATTAAANAAGAATPTGIAGMLANAGTYAQGAFAAGVQAAKSGYATAKTTISNTSFKAGQALNAATSSKAGQATIATGAQVGVAGGVIAGVASLPALPATGGNLYDAANQVESGVVSQWWNSLSPAQKNLGAQAAATIADGDTYDATNQVENGAFSQWYKSFSPAQQQDVQQQAAQSGVGLGDYLNSVAQYALAGANSAYYAGVNALGYQSQQPATQPATAANDQYNYDDLRNQYFI